MVVSLKTNTTVFTGIFEFNNKLHFENYLNAWKSFNLGRYFINTILIATSATAISLAISSFTSYIISRFNFKFKNMIYLYFILGLAIPAYTAIYPLFISTQKLHIYDSYLTLILVYVGWSLPISILIMVGFMKSIPKVLEEAGYIDGCNLFGVFTRIVFPLSRPAVLTVVTFNFVLGFWNEFILANSLISDPLRKTINAGLASGIAAFGYDYVGMSASIVMILIPEIIMFLIFQKYLVSGLTLGGVKE